MPARHSVPVPRADRDEEDAGSKGMARIIDRLRHEEGSKQMFTRIVVPLDGTRFAEAALALARELAHAFHSQILVVRAVPPTPLPRMERSWDEQQEEVERLNEADAYLHGIVDELRAQGY